MRIDSKRIYVRMLELTDVDELLELRVRNRDFLKPFEPTTPDSHFTLEGQKEALTKMKSDWDGDVGYGLGVFRAADNRLMGRVNLSNVVRGAWQSCTMGYYLDRELNGRGYTTEAVQLAVDFAFGDVNLHRIQAAVMPRNVGSIRVLEKAGFRYDGSSEYYLRINGVWEHHNLYSITQEKWK